MSFEGGYFLGLVLKKYLARQSSGTLRKRRTRHTVYLVFSTFLCCLTTAKMRRQRSLSSIKKSKTVYLVSVSFLQLRIYQVIILKSALNIKGLFKNLPYAADTPFNTAKQQHKPTCLLNTRINLQQQIHNWINKSDERTIF